MWPTAFALAASAALTAVTYRSGRGYARGQAILWAGIAAAIVATLLLTLAVAAVALLAPAGTAG